MGDSLECESWEYEEVNGAKSDTMLEGRPAVSVDAAKSAARAVSKKVKVLAGDLTSAGKDEVVSAVKWWVLHSS